MNATASGERRRVLHRRPRLSAINIYIAKLLELAIEQTKRVTSLAIILKRYHVLMYCV